MAKRLARDHSQEYVQLKTEYLEFLQAESPGKVKSPAAWLRRAIEDDFSAPDGFISAAEREERLKEQKAREQAIQEAQKRDIKRRHEEEKARAAREEEWRKELRTQYGTRDEDVEVWEQVLEEVHISLGDFTGSLFDRCQLLQMKDGVVLLGVPDDFTLRQLSHPNLQAGVGREFRRLRGQAYKFDLVRIEPPE